MLKHFAKTLARSAGYSVRRTTVDSEASLQLVTALRRFDIDSVFDVGANAGQFATELRNAGYAGDIVSFEPLSQAHRELSGRARRDPQWKVHPRGALGEFDGEIALNVSANSWSSSVLPMLASHSNASSSSAYVGIERVPVARLDSVGAAYLAHAKRPFLKLDTQGSEGRILDGAAAMLPRFFGVLCELSLVPLYEGQPLWLELIGRLEAQGFTLWAFRQGFVDPTDGRTLQVDATFFRMSD